MDQRTGAGDPPERKNLLVSAAAGSGKTAVLVERILSRVMDPQQPIDVDELLIVTFTRAAAGEMRERIGQALQRAIGEDPDNDHLQRQQTLLHHAQINTIHGFCSYVIQNYFQMIDLDPAYRMAEDGEIRLLRSDVVKEVLEEGYTEQTPEFENFIECYAAGKTDEGIEDLILNLFDFASSYPWPEEWLASCQETYEISMKKELEDSSWMRYLMGEAEKNLESIRTCRKKPLQCCPGRGRRCFTSRCFRRTWTRRGRCRTAGLTGNCRKLLLRWRFRCCQERRIRMLTRH